MFPPLLAGCWAPQTFPKVVKALELLFHPRGLHLQTVDAKPGTRRLWKKWVNFKGNLGWKIGLKRLKPLVGKLGQLGGFWNFRFPRFLE